MTQFSNYMADFRVEVKDVAVVREFLAPFKWDYYINIDHEKLGSSADLLTSCFQSDSFWSDLKHSHESLLEHYHLTLEISSDLQTSLDKL